MNICIFLIPLFLRVAVLNVFLWLQKTGFLWRNSGLPHVTFGPFVCCPSSFVLLVTNLGVGLSQLDVFHCCFDLMINRVKTSTHLYDFEHLDLAVSGTLITFWQGPKVVEVLSR